MLNELIATRLGEQVASLRSVGRAADLAAAQQAAAKQQFPCAFIQTLEERASETLSFTGALTQTRALRIGVLLAVKNFRDPHGTAAGGEMDSLRQQTDDALFGYLPDAAYTPLQFTQGRLLGMLDNELWWMDEYITEYQRRAL